MGNLRCACLFALLAACGAEQAPGTDSGPGGGSAAPSAVTPAAAPLDLAALDESTWPYRFTDGTEAAGLAGFQQVSGDPQKPFITGTIGGGVALFDADGDGDMDAYLSNGARFKTDQKPGEGAPRDALYLNDGKGHFTDATQAAGLGDEGWTAGVRIADYDGDGLRDIYLTNYGPNVLYRNLGAGHFEDVTDQAGVGDPSWSTGACFLDFDNDGDLDLYVSNYIDFDEESMLKEHPSVEYKGVQVMKGPRGLEGAQDHFYINQGDGTFQEASHQVGIDGLSLFAFQCVAFDVDRDGFVDIYVANDSVKNVLWHNEGGKGFKDSAFFSGLALSQGGKPQAGMGVALGDYDRDQNPDLFITNFADDYFTLYRGNARGSFVDASYRMKLVGSTKSALGWGCGFADFDSDGDQEIYMATGHVYPQIDGFGMNNSYRQKNILLELHDDVYRAPPGRGGPGFQLETIGRGSALGDVDGDGDLDILFGNLDSPPTLLINQAKPANWIKVRLTGAAANTEAVGARVRIEYEDQTQEALVATSGSFLSSSSPRLHFGLGPAASATRVQVTWPNGQTTETKNVPAGTLLRFQEQAGPPKSIPYGTLGGQ